MMARSATVFALLVSTAVSAAPTSPRHHLPPEPGLSCPGAPGSIASAICASPASSAAHHEMAVLSAVDRVSAFGTGTSNEAAAQRFTVEALQRCVARPSGDETACLSNAVDRRAAALAVAALLRSPGLALPALRRTDPVYEPVLEAVALWTSEPAGADWSAPVRADKRARILALLGPVMADLLTTPGDAFGREILTRPVGGGIAVRRVEDVLLSDRHFTEFLDVIGPYLKDDALSNSRRVLPCAAIVRRPALLAATDSIFGSSFDDGVFGTDCRDTLPPSPALASLDAKLWKGWPTCDGSIRYAAYRIHEQSLDAALLGIVAGGPMRPAPRRRGVGLGDVAAARAELSRSYVLHLGRSRAAAAAAASAAVDAVLRTGQECG